MSHAIVVAVGCASALIAGRACWRDGEPLALVVIAAVLYWFSGAIGGWFLLALANKLAGF